MEKVFDVNDALFLVSKIELNGIFQIKLYRTLLSILLSSFQKKVIKLTLRGMF